MSDDMRGERAVVEARLNARLEHLLERAYESAHLDGMTGAWHPYHHADLVREALQHDLLRHLPNSETPEVAS